jgi:hypothetical protein
VCSFRYCASTPPEGHEHAGNSRRKVPVSGGSGKPEEEGGFTVAAGVQNNNYWSGTSNANNTDNAWNVNMNNGNVNNNNKTNNNYVWPVRGGEQRFSAPEPFATAGVRSAAAASRLAGKAAPRRSAAACPDSTCLFRHAPQGCGFSCGLAAYPAPEYPLFKPEAVFTAYRRCRRRKRNTINAQRFEAGLEDQIFTLSRKLGAGTYHPGRSVVFMVNKPKRREIFAADFSDRVVHHLLVDELEPEWEKRFIYDSYACRKEKGTHKAVEQLRSFCRKVTNNNTRCAWYLQLDIRGFFINIDRRILFDRLAAFESDPLRLDLIRRLVFHEPVENCIFKGCTKEDGLALPAHKTLFHAKPFKGLPIGNLTSQFFANVYLDMLDQFIKRRMGVRYYVRYCDDFILLSDSPEQLKRQEAEIETFLRTQLRLELNPKRKLRRISDGIDFLGYIVRPDYLLVRRRAVNGLRERLTSVCGEKKDIRLPKNEAQGEWSGADNLPVPPAPATGAIFYSVGADGGRACCGGAERVVIRHDGETIQKVSAWLNSYHGHFRLASSHRLQASFLTHYPWIEDWFYPQPPFYQKHPPPVCALRFAKQVGWYRRQFPGHLLCIRLGKGFRLYPANEQQQRVLDLFGFPCNLPPSMEQGLRNRLWNTAVPVAWIERTEKFNGFVYERQLKEEWKLRET